MKSILRLALSLILLGPACHPGHPQPAPGFEDPPGQTVKRSRRSVSAEALLGELKDNPWVKKPRADLEAGAKARDPGATLALASLWLQGSNRDPARADELVREAAELGSRSACYLLGLCYLDDEAIPGETMIGNYQVAAEWFEKAASRGHARAAYELGNLYLLSKLPFDPRLASKWLQLAYQAGVTSAARRLVLVYETYGGPPEKRGNERTEMLRWMRVVARLREPDAVDDRTEMAEHLLQDNPSKEEKAESLVWLREAMADGSLQAEAFLGLLGEPVPPPDAAKVSGWEIESGMRPSSPASLRLGLAYERGEGVTNNLELALRYYAKPGLSRGGYQWTDQHRSFMGELEAAGVVRILTSGSFQPKNPASYDSLLPTHAAVLPDPNLRLQLAELLWKGAPYVKADRPKALQWFTAAAQAGNASAMFRLGEFWRDGLNGQPDLPESVRWFRRAAKQGLASAQLELARAYRDGKGVAADPAEAKKWFEQAAHQALREPGSDKPQ